MRYLIIFGILLAFGLLTAGCTSEVPEDTTPEIEENATVEEETPADIPEPEEVEEPVVDEEPEEEEPQDLSGTITTANLEACFLKCNGGAGSGPYCKDGCRFEEASRTADTAYCDQLDQKD